MTTFTSEDRKAFEKECEALEKGIAFMKELKEETEPIPFVGMVSVLNHDDIVETLREQIHAQNSEIMRLNERIRQLEAQLYGGSTK